MTGGKAFGQGYYAVLLLAQCAFGWTVTAGAQEWTQFEMNLKDAHGRFLWNAPENWTLGMPSAGLSVEIGDDHSGQALHCMIPSGCQAICQHLELAEHGRTQGTTLRLEKGASLTVVESAVLSKDRESWFYVDGMFTCGRQGKGLRVGGPWGRPDLGEPAAGHLMIGPTGQVKAWFIGINTDHRADSKPSTPWGERFYARSTGSEVVVTGGKLMATHGFRMSTTDATLPGALRLRGPAVFTTEPEARLEFWCGVWEIEGGDAQIRIGDVEFWGNKFKHDVNARARRKVGIGTTVLKLTGTGVSTIHARKVAFVDATLLDVSQLIVSPGTYKVIDGVSISTRRLCFSPGTDTNRWCYRIDEANGDLLLLSVAMAEESPSQDRSGIPHTYFVDTNGGDDSADGLSERTAWRSLARLQAVALRPGDTVRFKRGSRFNRTLTINDSGAPDRYITLTDYGDAQLPSAAFTNEGFDPEAGQFGNCIRLKGSFILVENLFFHNTVAELSGRVGFETMWELGALYIDRTAKHCVVQNNEFFDCGVGIKSYGEQVVIRDNYIRDCNRVLKKWSWGPIAIWLGADHQEVCHNRIFNYRAVDHRINWGPNGYGSGADGGAIEIDDARNAKSNISIHHNYSRDNQGFLEVTWRDLADNPRYTGFRIHHNVSDDFQQFLALWRGAACRIEHNTILRRKVNANEWGVFNITQYNSRNRVRNNIVVVERGVVIFNLGKDGNARANTVIENNLYYAASGELAMGLEGPGAGAIFKDPKFVNYAGGRRANDFALTAGSAAIDRGLQLGYATDHRGAIISTGGQPDIGAFEFFSQANEKEGDAKKGLANDPPLHPDR